MFRNINQFANTRWNEATKKKKKKNLDNQCFAEAYSQFQRSDKRRILLRHNLTTTSSPNKLNN